MTSHLAIKLQQSEKDVIKQNITKLIE